MTRFGLPAKLVVLAVVCWATGAGASDVRWRPADRPPEDGGFTRSMGIPSPVQVSAGAEFLAYRPGGDQELGGLGTLAVSRILGNPTVGIAAIEGEFYFGGRGKEGNVGARANLAIPALYIAGGADYDVVAEDLDFVLRVEFPMVRGGPVGAGSMVQLRWLPTRDHTFTVGLRVPLGRHMGSTRPPYDFVPLEKQTPQRLELAEPDAALSEALGALRDRARWIAWLSQPFTEESGADAHEAMESTIATVRERVAATRAQWPDVPALTSEIRAYHDALDLAFSRATSAAPGDVTERGREISAAARRVALDDVIFPYNYLFGQRKRPDTLRGWIGSAQTAFGRWLLSEANGLTRQEARQCFWVFQTLCDVLEENRAELEERWEDERLVWLPLQYGFRENEHDTQHELNEILERATLTPFEHQNRIWYLINEQFQYEVARSVQKAEDYHVLWIHDVAGKNHHGDPDVVAYEQIKNYIQTLTRRVQDYDETRKIPVYMIFLDQHYFEANKGHEWMRLLADPMHYKVRLPLDHAKMAAEIGELQQELRGAVDESVLLGLERSQYGDTWLANRIRVHVNITNPSDFSFRSLHVIGRIPIPDNNMRDHRKILFYDLDEEDPYRGEAMFTGMGIGEHYVGSNWEDRAVVIQGPGALPVKEAARQLLLQQGFDEDEIPWVLRPKPRGADFDRAVAREDAAGELLLEEDSGILQLHNATGFTDKPINVAKAVKYSLMPAGSVLMIPDSLWQSHVYASLLAGSALRGCRSLIVAPTLASAPSSGWPQMARAHGLMSRILVFSQALDDEIGAADGVLAVGLYNPRHKVGDIAGRMEQAIATRPDWGDRIGSMDPSVHRVLANTSAQLDSLGYEIEYLSESDETATPKLHLKANFFASAPVWRGLMAHPGWAGVVEAYITYLAGQQGQIESGERTTDPRLRPGALQERGVALLQDYLSGLSEKERAEHIIYLTVGSTNMDYRSMIQNGEVQVALSGIRALNGVLDFLLLTGLCDWPETTEEIDELLPPPSGMKRRIASFVKVAL